MGMPVVGVIGTYQLNFSIGILAAFRGCLPGLKVSLQSCLEFMVLQFILYSIIYNNNLIKFDLESQACGNELQPFLFQSKEGFLYEFINFARYPFNIDLDDRHANYDYPALSREQGSNSESSNITMSPNETETPSTRT